jgi:hypothetical protein
VASTRNGDTRRSPKKDELIKGILDSYHVTVGCPPLAQHWGGHDLAKTDWLKRFAKEIADNNNRSLEAWNTLKKKCDTSFIIELLYLMTIRGRYRAEESQDSDHLLATEIEKILPKYGKLLEDIDSLIQDPRVSAGMPYAQFDLAKESKTLQDSKQRLEVLRDYYKGFGSYKRNQRDWYLHLMASHVSNAIGNYHVRFLMSLIDSARAAHNERRKVSDEGALTKRIQRYKQFLKSLNSIRNRNGISSSADPISF